MQRDLEVAYLRLQELARKGRITVKKVSVQLNFADMVIKYLSGVNILTSCRSWDLELRRSAPTSLMVCDRGRSARQAIEPRESVSRRHTVTELTAGRA